MTDPAQPECHACEICKQPVDQSIEGKTVNSNGKHWHWDCYKFQEQFDQTKMKLDECVERLKAHSELMVSAPQQRLNEVAQVAVRNEALEEAAVMTELREAFWLSQHKSARPYSIDSTNGITRNLEAKEISTAIRAMKGGA